MSRARHSAAAVGTRPATGTLIGGTHAAFAG